MIRHAIIVGLISSLLQSCYFFRDRETGVNEASETTEVAGGGVLGSRAGGSDNLLAQVHSTLTERPPASVRPDPDVFVRRLLLQHREVGTIVARQIGRVEQYRSLLGGASVDFSVAPQESFDATSLLASFKVAEEVCTSLVDPNEGEHPGWETILPTVASDSDTNIRFLAQRFLGIPSGEIPPEVMESLRNVYNSAATGAGPNNAQYVLVCAALLMDAGSLLL